LTSYEEISAKIKYRLKPRFFYQLSMEDIIPSKAQKNKGFQLEERQDLIQKK